MKHLLSSDRFMRHALAVLTALGMVFAARVFAAADSARKPNFVIIFCDDLGYQDVGCFGSPLIKTPHIDRMAEEGMRFTDFYSSAPVCSASRAALMTGCYPLRVGVPGVFFPNRGLGLSPKEVTIAEMLKQAGYATMCVGKWHLGDDKPFLPTRQGFDAYYGIPYSNDMTLSKTATFAADCVFREGESLEAVQSREKARPHWVPLFRDEDVIEYPADQSTLTQRYTEASIRFIKQNKGNPFFLYLANTMPHVPLAASSAFSGNSARGLYGDTVEEIDWQVGRILQTLKDEGLDDQTLVVFTSDNGPWLKKGDAGGCALPLRDGKFTTFDGGQREPCVMRWPGHIPAGKVTGELASTIDLFPTFAALGGGTVPTDRMIDGMDMTLLLTGETTKSPRDTFYYMKNAVRVGKWKLHLSGKSTVAGEPFGKPPLLYDLSNDIGEKHNLAAEYPEIVERLSNLLNAHIADLNSNSRPVAHINDYSER